MSNFVSTSTGVSGSPTLIKRELKSDLSLLDGEIVVMGGLSESKDTGATNGLSLLPEFLQSKSSDKTTAEILVILQVTKLGRGVGQRLILSTYWSMSGAGRNLAR